MFFSLIMGCTREYGRTGRQVLAPALKKFTSRYNYAFMPTIPPKTLWSRLTLCEAIGLRDCHSVFLRSISGTEARAMAMHGLIEGFVSSTKPKARIKYVRLLDARAQQPECDVRKSPDVEQVYKPKAASVLAATRMGVYRETLNEALVDVEMAPEGPFRKANGEGMVHGWCYAFREQPPTFRWVTG
jgi:hypothetical protein